MVFGIAAARGHEGAEIAAHFVLGALHIIGVFGADEADGDGVVENRRVIDQLMCGAADGDAESGSAGAAFLHDSSLEEAIERMLFPMNWIGWALLSAVFAAATALLAKVGVAHVDSNLAMALRTSVVVVFAWGIVLGAGRTGIGEITALDRRTCMFLALSGLATGLSWLCYFRALQLGPASRVAPLDKLSVPLVMVFAWLLLEEKLTTPAMVGGLLITLGAVVMVMGS
jgi:transporter family protein